MIKEQLIQARELIKRKRYDEARAILYTIEHPTAQQWLNKLNQIAPPSGDVEVVETSRRPDTQQIKAMMLQARDLIMQKDYDAARAILERVDHPTARDWLGKLTIMVTGRIAPPNVNTGQLSAHDTMPLDSTSHDAILRQAQEALLNDQYEEARELLAPLHTAEAAFWLEKTGMTRFRTYENIWLDLFRYVLPAPAQNNLAGWRCEYCGRNAEQALTCPQRDENPCPVKINARSIEEPRRLALLLQALYLDQGDDIERIMIHIETARLAHWRSELKWQVENMNPTDIRHDAIERAIPLLDRHIRARLAESKRAVRDQAHARSQTPPPPPAPEPVQRNDNTPIYSAAWLEMEETPPPPQANPARPMRPIEPIEEPVLRQVVNAIIRFFINQ